MTAACCWGATAIVRCRASAALALEPMLLLDYQKRESPQTSMEVAAGGTSPSSPAAKLVAFTHSYADAGFMPVLLKPNEKAPAYSHWQSMPAATVAQILSVSGSYNVGIAIPENYFVLDIDVKNGQNGMATLQAWEDKYGPLQGMPIQCTPSGGFHYLFKLPAGVRLKNSVKFAPGLDVRTSGGFIATEPSVINGTGYWWQDWDVLAEPMPEIPVAPDWLVEKCLKREDLTVAKNVTEGDELVIAEGQRNETLYRKACALRRQGFDEKEIQDAVTSMNQRSCRPPLVPNEIVSLVHSAASHPAGPAPGAPSPAQKRSFGLKDSTAARLFIGAPPPAKWLIEQILPHGKVSIVASPPGVGKSYLVLDLAVNVAATPAATLWDGARFSLGGRVRAQGRVVIISAEDDLEELHRRLYALVDGGAMPEKLHIMSLPDQGHFCIVQGDSRKNLAPTEAWLALKEEILQLGDVQLVVVDTLQAVSTGDLNAAEIAQALMNELVELATRSGASVVLIHHIVKKAAAEQKGLLTSQDAMDAVRGSGAIVGSARAAYVLYPHPAGEDICEVMGIKYEQNKVVYGLVAKANGAARRDYTIYIRDEHGVLRDRSHEYRRRTQDSASLLDGELAGEIVKAYRAGAPFAASAASSNGLHKRRFELPQQFHDLPARWFVEHAGALVRDEKVRKKKSTNGYQYAPVGEPDAEVDVDGLDPVESKEGLTPVPPVGKPGKKQAATKKAVTKKTMPKKGCNKNDV